MEIEEVGAEKCSDDSFEIMSLLKGNLTNQADLDSKICFMDMRAEKELCPDDAKTLKFVVFGGILGDHPP